MALIKIVLNAQDRIGSEHEDCSEAFLKLSRNSEYYSKSDNSYKLLVMAQTDKFLVSYKNMLCILFKILM